MNIETKHSINDTVVYLHESRIHTGIVTSILVRVVRESRHTIDKTKIHYTVADSSGYLDWKNSNGANPQLEEYLVAKTREELAQQL